MWICQIWPSCLHVTLATRISHLFRHPDNNHFALTKRFSNLNILKSVTIFPFPVGRTSSHAIPPAITAVKHAQLTTIIQCLFDRYAARSKKQTIQFFLYLRSHVYYPVSGTLPARQILVRAYITLRREQVRYTTLCQFLLTLPPLKAQVNRRPPVFTPLDVRWFGTSYFCHRQAKSYSCASSAASSQLLSDGQSCTCQYSPGAIVHHSIQKAARLPLYQIPEYPRWLATDACVCLVCALW